MNLPLFQVDAFTDAPFRGNPAAVFPLAAWLPDDLLQAIALENNLSETAFFVPEGDDLRLRWFTPACEVDLCGHATLAAAAVILRRLEPARQGVRFLTRSGPLEVSRDGPALRMDFPARPPRRVDGPPDLLAALGGAPTEVWAARDVMAVYATADEVRALAPDVTAIGRMDCFAVMVTAPGDGGADFVSRFFAPGSGVPEDPVTGSAHCTLAPYWASRLGRQRLLGRQVSARGGEVDCEVRGARVWLRGQAVIVMEGRLMFSRGAP